MATAGEGGLRAVREMLLFCVADGIIDFEEYFLLLELNKLREIYPC